MGDPGHPLNAQAAHQGKGRWDNPTLYTVMYLSASAEAAVGEAFGNLATWSPGMLGFPQIRGSVRSLGTFELNEEAHPVIDLDDTSELAQRGIRPAHVVVRNRPRTQQIAADLFSEGRWSGIQWWSYHRPQWTAIALWDLSGLKFRRVEDLRGHPALDAAAKTLSISRRDI
ncbi:MAG: RES domain-containing protein [Actinomycetota bacterium]|nr:RES domain-containing protein [Actinomycetota bacterium]